MPFPLPTHSPAIFEAGTPLQRESVSTGVGHGKQVLLFVHLLNMGWVGGVGEGWVGE